MKILILFIVILNIVLCFGELFTRFSIINIDGCTDISPLVVDLDTCALACQKNGPVYRRIEKNPGSEPNSFRSVNSNLNCGGPPQYYQFSCSYYGEVIDIGQDYKVVCYNDTYLPFVSSSVSINNGCTNNNIQFNDQCTRVCKDKEYWVKAKLEELSTNKYQFSYYTDSNCANAEYSDYTITCKESGVSGTIGDFNMTCNTVPINSTSSSSSSPSSSNSTTTSSSSENNTSLASITIVSYSTLITCLIIYLIL